VKAPGSLRARIALAAIAALALTGAIATPLLLAEVERDGRQAVDRELEQRAEALTRRGPGPPPPGAVGGFEEWPGPGAGMAPRPRERSALGRERSLLAGSGSFVQVALDGQVVERRGDVPADPPEMPDEDGLSTVGIAGTDWRSLSIGSERRGEAGLRYQLLSTLEPVEERVSDIRRLVLLLGLGALAVTGVAAWGFTTVAVRPLERLRAGAERVSGAADLTTPLPADDGPDEVRSLAHTLNEMLARLRASTDAMERALAATRRFARDAGHELRTPLTGMRANLDAVARNPEMPAGQRQALLQEVTAEQERIVHLLDGLQALARGEAAESLPREDVELGDVVDSALFAARRRHPEIAYEVDDRIERAGVHGWAGGLRLLIDNLLDNAALHGRPEGRVRVGLEPGRHGGLLVRVEDDGRGIPEQERPRLLEPFARGAGAKAGGTGLGLAIVAQQVALHGGSLELGESPLGGLQVEVRLPVVTPARPA
jgi:two-component system, OmpR family, sensor histidine kinase PrrB